MDPSIHFMALSAATDKATLIPALEELGTYICIGLEDFIRAFDATKGIQVLLGITNNFNDDDVLVLVYRCMALVLEYVPHSSEALVNSGVLPSLIQTLKKSFNLEMIEELLKVLKHVSVDDSTCVLLRSGAVPALISSMDVQDRRLHPTSIAILENIILKVSIDGGGTSQSSSGGGLFGKSKKKSIPKSPTVNTEQIASTIKNEIIPSLKGLLETLNIQDLDQGGARDVATALCSCICTLVERCHQTVPNIVFLIEKHGFVDSFIKLLQAASSQSDESQQSLLIKTLGVLSSANYSAVVPVLVKSPDLLQIVVDLIVPEHQDFASMLKDPFGTQQEQERQSGAGHSKSSYDLRSDVLYLLYSMTPSLPQGLITIDLLPVRRDHQWEWEDDFHALNPYESSTQIQLEKTFQTGSTQHSVAARGTSYTVDFNVMKQINPSTGVTRNVKRYALPTAYFRRERDEKEKEKIKAAPVSQSSTKKGSSAGMKKSDGKENLLLQKAHIPPSSCYSSSEEGINLAVDFFSKVAGALSQYAVQCGDTGKREWATEVLARVTHCVVASLRNFPTSNSAWQRFTNEVHVISSMLSSNIPTLIGKGLSEHSLLDHALLTIDLLSAVCGPTLSLQLRKGGLVDAMTSVSSQAKTLPASLQKRVSMSAFGTVSTKHEKQSEESRKLAAIASRLGSEGDSVIPKIFDFLSQHAGDLSHTDLQSSGLTTQIINWLSIPHTEGRHIRYKILMDALQASPAGSRALTDLLSQSIVALESFPMSFNVADAASVSKEHIKKKARSSSTTATASASTGGSGKRPIHTGEFLKGLGRRGIQVIFSPDPLRDEKSASSSEPSESRTITVDPFAVVGCLERYLNVVTTTGEIPSSNGMRVLTGSTARFMLEGLSNSGDDGQLLQEVLRKMEDEAADISFEEDEDDEDSGGSAEGQEVVIVDGSQVSLYDDKRKPPSSPSSALTPPHTFTLSMNDTPLQRTSTMLDVARLYFSHHHPEALTQIDSLLHSPPSSKSTISESIDKLQKKHQLLTARISKVEAQSRKKSDSKTELNDLKLKLQQLDAKILKLNGGGIDIWSTPIKISWLQESSGAKGSMPSPPSQYSDKTEVLSSSLDKIVQVGIPDIEDPQLQSMLRLMSAIHQMRESSEGGIQVPTKAFNNPHITAKLMQTLLTNCLGIAMFGHNGLPPWCESLVTSCPYLFPIAARKEFLNFVYVGATRSLFQFVKTRSRIPHADVIQPEVLPSYGLPKLPVNRSKLEDSANALLAATSWRKSLLEVQYEGEEGTGLGPTLEFFTTLSREYQKEKSTAALWRTVNEGGKDIIPAAGCFPSPDKRGDGAERDEALFQMLGRLTARALSDGRLLDIPLSKQFLRLLRHWNRPTSTAWMTIKDVIDIDPTLGKSLQFFIDFSTRYDAASPAERPQLAQEAHLSPDVSVDDAFYFFVLPGTELPLKPGGENIPVTAVNVREFVYLACEFITFSAIRSRLSNFVAGFEETLPLRALTLFSEQELVALLIGDVNDTDPLWTESELNATIIADHGYSSESRCIRDLIDILANSFSPAEQRMFLNWATGCPRLPIGGLTAVGKITVVKKTDSATGDSDKHLPSCNTCFRYLKLPTYSSKEILATKLRKAIIEGSESFSLS
eukprot:TRINITY_DN1132_c0_g5_i1.p1 TRINITY_DN1132_c0_g5~~TRINITY_DN1132_c0_g5_i1.p1  ORF type:complete len:1665 (+),score=382.27 TRINITY_DN1132_c0_g5_i1:86-4996(+)